MNRQSAQPADPTDLRRAVGAALRARRARARHAGRARSISRATSGAFTGSWDTTVSLRRGLARQEARTRDLIGIADGGTGRSPNVDNGDLNYRVGQPFSQVLKLATELSLKYQNLRRVRARLRALRRRRSWTGRPSARRSAKAAKDLAGSYTRLLDAFVYGKWELGDGHPLELRLGNQVRELGREHVHPGRPQRGQRDRRRGAARRRAPRLKEAFLPQPMVRATSASREQPDGRGLLHARLGRDRARAGGHLLLAPTISSPRGGNQVFLGFGAFSDQGVDFRPLGGPFIPNFQGVPRGAGRDAEEERPVRRRAALVRAELRQRHRVRLVLRATTRAACR